MPATLGYVGDSLTVQLVANAVRDALYADLGYDAATLKVDGLVGRSIINGVAPYIPSSQDVITTWRAGGFQPHLWVIGLITNNFGQSLASLKADINTLLDLIVADPPAKVIWIGPVLQTGSALQTQIPTMYQALNEVAAARTDVTMRVFDLQAAYRNGRDETGHWSGGDGRHMTTAGYTVRNQLIDDFIEEEALTGVSRLTGLRATTGATPQARTRLTRLQVAVGAVAQARTRLTRIAVTFGGSIGRSRLTRVAVEAGAAPTGHAATRLTQLLVTTQGVLARGKTRLTDVKVEAGPPYQQQAALPSVFYLAPDGSYRPFQLLTMDDYPW